MYNRAERGFSSLYRQGQSCLELDTSQLGWLLPTHTPQSELSRAGPRLYMHDLAPGSGEPTPNGLWVNSSSMSTQRHGRSLSPQALEGDTGALSAHQPGCSSHPCNFWSCCGAVTRG